MLYSTSVSWLVLLFLVSLLVLAFKYPVRHPVIGSIRVKVLVIIAMLVFSTVEVVWLWHRNTEADRQYLQRTVPRSGAAR